MRWVTAGQNRWIDGQIRLFYTRQILPVEYLPDRCIINKGVLLMKHEEISLNTKKALAEALKLAMKKKPFQKITVSELIEACHVNRKTFYYHFEDIYALL